MKWMQERDLLIAQTMAFVQSVTGKKPDADAFMAAPKAEQAPTAGVSVTAIEAILIETIAIAEPPKPARPIQVALPDLRGDFQSEIKARIANFRALTFRVRALGFASFYELKLCRIRSQRSVGCAIARVNRRVILPPNRA